MKIHFDTTTRNARKMEDELLREIGRQMEIELIEACAQGTRGSRSAFDQIEALNAVGAELVRRAAVRAARGRHRSFPRAIWFEHAYGDRRTFSREIRCY